MDTSSLLAFSDQLADAVASIAPSVVQVLPHRRPASGVVFDADTVITTSRALGRDDTLKVRTDDGRVLDAEIKAWDPATRLVLVRAPGLAAPVPLRAEAPVRVGQIGLGVGRSWSNAITATSGIVSVIGGPLPTGPGQSIDRVIRTNAQMHSGFAGGAFIDATGRLTGIATAAEIRGLAVVIPIDIAWKTAATLAEHGTMPRGYLGLSGQPVDLPARQREKADATRALLVAAVSAGGPADTGGILVGDVIVSFDGHSVRSPVDLLELLGAESVGKVIDVQLVRGGAAQTVRVRVGTRPRG